MGRRHRLPDAHHIAVREAPCRAACSRADSCFYTRIRQRLLGGAALCKAAPTAINCAISTTGGPTLLRFIIQYASNWSGDFLSSIDLRILACACSEGMLKALGPHRNARVILPIPDVEPIKPSKS